MKKKLFLLLVSFVLACSISAGNDGKQMAALFEKILSQEEIHPDSIWASLRMLEQKRAEARTPQEKVMYAVSLGKLYSLRAGNSQSAHQHTHAPIDSIQEWSFEDYQHASRRCFEEALADKDLLFSMPTRDWVPLVSQGADDATFGSNMLYVIWRSAVQTGQPVTHPTFAEMIQYYKGKGLREAAFLLEMDSLDFADYSKREAGLKRIAEDYADLSVSAQALLQQILEFGGGNNWKYWESRQGREERYMKLKAILDRYPKYKNRGSIENAMLMIKEPMLSYDWPKVAYTGREMPISMCYRNVSAYNVMLYLLPDSMDLEKTNELDLAWVKKNARLTGSCKRTGLSADPFEEIRDTLRMMVPEHGIYAIIVEGQTNEKVEEKSVKVGFFCASHFLPVYTMVGDKTYLSVLNSLSGKPEAGVEVDVNWSATSNEDEQTDHYVTDNRGRVVIKHKQKRSPTVRLKRGKDCAQHAIMLGYARPWVVSQDSLRHCAVNTDRAIYRPGQTIHIAGTTFRQLEWDAVAGAGMRVKVCMRDTEYKVVLDTTLVADEFGCVALDYEIPKNTKLGMYRIEMGDLTKYVKVEEYKRPTFEVKMEEPVLGDSVLFAGRAQTYAGVPVRNARVTGHYSWSHGWLRIAGQNSYVPPTQIDTLWTDEEGRFTVRVPININKEDLRVGRWLSLSVDVLHNNGETQSGEASASLCSTPLRMYAEIFDLQDKDRLRPWKFNLYDALGKEVKADVKVELLGKDGKSVFTAILPSNKAQSPEGQKNIPSGAYTLRATSVVKGDTATVKERIVFHSMQDNALPVDTAKWFYLPNDKFAEGQPAKIQVGSSLKDVTLNYMVTSQGKVFTDEQICFSDSAFILNIPYQKAMDKGASVVFYFVKEDKVYKDVFDLHLAMPDYKLKAHWTTFRDKLKPGQRETWSLTLQRPDGTPAQANLLAVLYDASLDAFASHSLDMRVSRGYNIGSAYPDSPYRFDFGNSLNFHLKYKKEHGWWFGSLDDTYFLRRMVPVKSMMTLRGVAGGKMTNAPVMRKSVATSSAGISAKDFEALGVTSVDEALQGRIAGLDIVPANQESSNVARPEEFLSESPIETDDAMSYGSEMGMQVDWSALRTNFSETAFFYPQLRTNPQGEVSIEFTLPESLTRWHFLGVAHTRDMLVGNLDESIVAQKSLMAQLYLPRFLRVGDKASLTASIQNIDEEKAEKGSAVFEILDARTEKVLLRKKMQFHLAVGKDTVFHFDYEVKDAQTDLICRWVANGELCSDGEQRLLPVLSDRETVVTTKALTLLETGTLSYDLKNLFPKDAVNSQMTVEYTTHPVWNAIEALSTLSMSKCEDVLSQATVYYASVLSQHILKSVPDAENVLKISADTLAERANSSFQNLKSLQLKDGSFAWFPGMTGNNYLTREVAYLLVRLQSMVHHQGVRPHDDAKLNGEIKGMLGAAIKYLRSLQKKDEKISTVNLRHLYIVSMAGEPLNKVEKDLLAQLVKTSEEWNLEDRALAAIVLCLQDKNRAKNKLMDGVEKYLVGSPEKGSYIDYPSGSFTSIDRKLHIHTQIMEAVKMVRPEEKELWSGMVQYLLLQKRTTDWNTPVNTANAVYALMQGERTDLQDEAQDRLVVKGRKYSQVFKPEDHAKGYLKDTVQVEAPQNLRIEKQSKGQSWAAVYAQFEQQIDSVEAVWQGVRIRREVSNLNPKVGEKVYVRYVITATQDYDYVLLHTPRPATMETQLKRSGYRYSNGLGYYCTVRDTATDYYINHLPKGTYVLEEEMIVERTGQYNAGITTIQCLYAPEYSARTGNLKIFIK